MCQRSVSYVKLNRLSMGTFITPSILSVIVGVPGVVLYETFTNLLLAESVTHSVSSLMISRHDVTSA